MQKVGNNFPGRKERKKEEQHPSRTRRMTNTLGQENQQRDKGKKKEKKKLNKIKTKNE